MLLDVQKNVCLMHIGKEREWVKEAYSIVLMQIHVNGSKNRERERESDALNNIGIEPSQEKRLTKGKERIGGE